MRESAIKYLALYLKAHNPKVRAPHIRHRHGGKLHEFTECCGLVDALLAHEATKVGRKGRSADMAAAVGESEEHARLVAMWDGLKTRDVADFMPKPGASSP
mmetsp:Transcript_37805/g.94409  ORF Transcript_37805/g.94409 Transcript_37805/m.94409 type:complete len:101 (-) Transcript_37805:102-404(-)